MINPQQTRNRGRLPHVDKEHLEKKEKLTNKKEKNKQQTKTSTIVNVILNSEKLEALL